MSNKTKVIINAFIVIFLLSGIVLCTSTIQGILLSIGEKIIGRKFNHPEHWTLLMVRVGVLSFFFAIFFGWLLLRENTIYQNILAEHKQKIEFFASLCIIFMTFFIFMMPFVIFGKNSVMTIHDNMDGGVALFRYIHNHKLFWAFDEQIPLFGGISTLFLNREGFALYNFLYCLLPTYTGYVVNHIISAVIGFLCMYFLQKMLFKQTNTIILILTSLAYAMLPSVTVYKMAVATLPFVPVLFYKLMATKERKWIVLSFVYPFMSEFSSVGLFVCGFWLIAMIVVNIKERRLNKRLFLGFLLICIGFFVVISRLIYMRFVIHEPLNRDFFTIAPVPFIRSFIRYFFHGHYHSATLQDRLVNWVILGVLIAMFIKYLKNKQQKQSYFNLVILICLGISLFCSIIAALSDAKIMDKIIRVIFPPLTGISLTRIYTVTRVACYVAFTTSLLYIAENRKLLGISYAIAVLQLIIVFMGFFPTHVAYADSKPTWRKNLMGNEDISWNEFYSEKLFLHIKNSICYNNEPVCAVGYHPSVLLYNDFTTIDGYISVYPRSQQVLWHNLMKPEFDRNPEDMHYFDSWGGRRYVYNKDLPYKPTREKYHEPVNLYINMNILKKDFRCKYILSRAELSNVAEIGLKHRGTFDLPESLYVIWVYEVE